jgi:transmembrane sensor
MEFKGHKIEDFLTNDSFVDWVLYANDDIFWQDYQKENPSQINIIKNAVAVITASKSVPYPSLTNNDKSALWNKIQMESTQNDNSKKKFHFNLWQIAAAAVFLLITGMWFFNVNDTNESVSINYKLAANSVKTKYQERQQLTLPDGSKVTLNAHSSIKVSDRWDDNHTREVWLDGEAFFEVVKKKNTGAAKFIVHTPQLSIEVLGTAFNVKTRRGATEVVLQSGKVILKKPNKPSFKQIEMVPGDRVEIVENELQPIITEKVETEKVTSWTNGKIIFENTPLIDVAKSIEDHYGYKVNIKDGELRELSYTGELLTDMPEIFFEILSKTMNVKVNIVGKNMDISKI